MGTDKKPLFSLNVNAELYEDQFADLAVRFPDERVYRNVGTAGSRFQLEVVNLLEKGERPAHWQEMPPHELLYGKGWRCIATLGYRDGDPRRPAVTFEVDAESLGEKARAYLAAALPGAG
jgi:hypothetical protein